MNTQYRWFKKSIRTDQQILLPVGAPQHYKIKINMGKW